MVSSFLLIFGRFRMGSALRGRGKARISPFRRMSSGITPACTWKRQTGVRNASHSRDHPPRVRGKCCTRRKPCPRWDHPRVCGEKAESGAMSSVRQGSPPRVRGKASAAAESTLSQRITPACAGKRLQRPRDSRRAQDHPRVCGEKSTVGSSSVSL